MQTMTVKLTICLALLLMAAGISAEEDVKTLLQKGGMGLMQKDYPKAIDNYGAVLQLEPDNVEALKNIGLAHSAVGSSGVAKEYLEKAYRLDPNDADLCNNLGVIYSGLGRINDAIRYFGFAVAIAPDNFLNLTNLAQEHMRNNAVGKAFPLLRKADSLQPEHRTVLFELGNAHAAAGVYDSAEVFYERCLVAGGGSAQLHYFLGVVQQRLGKAAEAEENLRQGVTYAPDHLECLQALGMVLYSEKRYAEAVEQFNRIVKIDSTNLAGWIAMGASLALDGSIEQSEAVLERLFAADSAVGLQMIQMIGAERRKAKGLK
jgi:tetratricopeptide (TPR) repeat protein